jgi:coproporphyrinogen III oxidase-like Fe-S oxidoreductase
VSYCGEGARRQRDEPLAKYSQLSTDNYKSWQVVNALLRELGLYGKVLRDLSLSVVEIHIGGGTPSVSPLTVFDGICKYL